MDKDSVFFINIFKAGFKLISDTTEAKIGATELELELEKNDDEWKQEYELIYQSYSFD